MQSHNNHSRRNFLKGIPLAFGSVIFLSGFKSEKNGNIADKQPDTLSREETNKILKNEKFPVTVRLSPSPAPLKS